jgi:hypothetical protein
VQKVATLSLEVVVDTAVSTATIGALATVIFKFVSSLSGKNMKSILKDDLFGAFYTQLLYFGTMRQKLLSKEMSLADFIASVKIVCQNATEIYNQNISPDDKRRKLADLLRGIIDDQSISACLEVLHQTMQMVTTEKAQTTHKK